MFESLFWRQLQATVERIVLIKLRSKLNLFFEIFMPLYFVAILAIIQRSIPDSVVDAVNETQTVGRILATDVPRSIAVVPNNSDTRGFVLDMEKIAKQELNVVYFHDEETMLNAYRNNASRFVSAVTFSEKLHRNGSYTMYFPTEEIPNIAVLNGNPGDCRNISVSTCPPIKYLSSGFIQLQTLIDSTFIKIHSNITPSFPEISLKLMPKPKALINPKLMRSLLPIYMVLAFSPFVTYVVIVIVNDKEKKIQESMKIMGLINAVYWLSWFLVYGVFVVFLALITSILINVSKILVLSNIFLIFCSLFLYGLSIITMSFMITPFFNNAKVAGAVCSLTMTVFSCLYYIIVYVNNISPVVYWIISLLSPTALAVGMDLAVRSELSGDGLSFKNISDGSFPFAATLIMLAVDVVLYALLAFYFDSVVPGEYGRKRKPWFCFLPSYWCRQKNEPTLPNSNVFDSNVAEGDTCVDPASKNFIHKEMVPLELQGKEAIKLTSVKKVFRRRHKEDLIAVNGVSLDIYEGQILALLGHNGAGKTTLVNMMLGMIPQTEGLINIFGLDVSDCDDLSKIRRMTGICCQSDILFENLTVREHLRFYAKIKDVPFAQVNQEIDRVLHDVDLTTKENARAKSLSGGQKRKLSLAIALIGNPKIIILDEPTSGVDPYSRRHLWSLLQRIKSDKVIVLTTHHMDEADILADRKAILVKGCLRCVGSSLFLKNKFGSGYQLVLVVNESPDEERIYSLIRSHVPEAKKIPSRGEELVYTLPLDVVSKFPTLLSAIDEIINIGSSNDLGIKGYGVSMTSLEEVFLKLGEDDGENVLETEEIPVSQKVQVRSLSRGDQATTNFENSEHEIAVENCQESFIVQCVNTNPNSGFQAFKALLKIRFLIDLRLPKNIFSIIIFPVIFTCISLYLMNSSSSSKSSSKLNINPALYQRGDGNPPLLFNRSDSKEKDLLVLLKNINSLGVRTSEYSDPIEALLDNTPHFFFLGIKALDLHTQKLILTAIYNDTSTHALPTLMNILNNARLPSSFIDSQAPFLRLTVKNFPSSILTSDNYSMMFGPIIFLGLIFAISPSNLVIDVIEDKENKIKHLLRINGISFFVYWGSFFCCHLSILAVCLLAMIVIILAFKMTMFMTAGPMICFLIMYLLYLPLGLLFFYLLSFLFKKHEQAQSFLWFFPMLLGVIPYIISVVVDVSSSSGPTLHYVFSFVFALYPAFSNLYYISKVYMIHELLKMEAKFTDYFCKEIIVTLFAMIFNIVFYCALIKLCDVYTMNGQIFPHKKQTSITIPSNSEETENEDSDVKAEREFVESVNSEDIKEIPLLINSLGKEFDSDEKEMHFWDKLSSKKKHNKNKKKAAVYNLCLAVHKNDVFGLLGPNGAGKTTTLRMIATDEKPTSGKITIGGFDPTLEPEKVYQQLGYCPQFDALWKNITLEEHLCFFAAVRGLPSEQIPSILKGCMNGLRIKEHAHKRSKTLSGGTCRKLSFAISMLGNSCIVLLDEPSTGMDPQSKRFLWNTIAASFHNKSRGAILTTHSMEEADVLCTRIGIMVKGKLKCLGSSQHLKNKYGSGYLLEIQLSSDQPLQERFDQLEKFIHDLFSTYVIQEKFGTFIKVSIPQTDVGSLAKVFNDLESAKTRLGIVYYSLSQSSLEQVFLEFAKLQDVE